MRDAVRVNKLYYLKKCKYDCKIPENTVMVK